VRWTPLLFPEFTLRPAQGTPPRRLVSFPWSKLDGVEFVVKFYSRASIGMLHARAGNVALGVNYDIVTTLSYSVTEFSEENTFMLIEFEVIDDYQGISSKDYLKIEVQGVTTRNIFDRRRISLHNISRYNLLHEEVERTETHNTNGPQGNEDPEEGEQCPP